MPPPIYVGRRVYDELERKVMNPFKNDYMNCSTPAERKAFATSKFFPKLFNHWAKIGVNLNSDEMDKRTEVCCMCL